VSNRYTNNGKRRSSMTHAKYGHKCECGKVVFGNGYRNHFRACKVREEIRAKQPMSVSNISDANARRLLEIGKKMPSLKWWYSFSATLGCSPRDAVDAGRISDVEALLP
jgi:hypothetical protein